MWWGLAVGPGLQELCLGSFILFSPRSSGNAVGIVWEALRTCVRGRAALKAVPDCSIFAALP